LYIWVAAVKALRKKERQDETQLSQKQIDGFEQGSRVIIVVVHLGCSSGSAQEKGKTGKNSVITQKN
jgi:ribosomal protein L21E